MTKRDESARPSTPSAASATTSGAPTVPTDEQISLRSPAELADALPYLLGFFPDDSVVMVALHGERGRFGGRLRLGIPRTREEWPEVSTQLAETLIAGSSKRGARPDGIVLFLCQDPGPGETARDVMERLHPFAQCLRLACGGQDVPVYEALCISDGRFWSYCCPDTRCCPPEGTPLAVPGTSVMAAAAAYAGIQVRGSLRQMEARLAPLTGPPAEEQERALDAAAVELVPRILRGTDCETVRDETMGLARLVLDRLHAAPPNARRPEADAQDDALLAHDEAAAIILGLQDRVTRDRAAEWMEGPLAPTVLRLWRALARRCVSSYAEHAAAPLTLAGWVAWSTGDQPEARVALSRALAADPDYLFAQLLQRACNEGMDPEPLRRCLRRERADRAVHAAAHAEADRARSADAEGDARGVERAPRVRRRRRPPLTGAAEAGPGDRTAGPLRNAGSVRPTGPGGANGPAGKARVRRRNGPRGTRGRQ
ncbi:DUF4192 domain-containing protein [Streptomyces netropsis]